MTLLCSALSTEPFGSSPPPRLLHSPRFSIALSKHQISWRPRLPQGSLWDPGWSGDTPDLGLTPAPGHTGGTQTLPMALQFGAGQEDRQGPKFSLLRLELQSAHLEVTCQVSVGEHFLGASGHCTRISIWFYALNFLLFKCSFSRSSQPSQTTPPLGCCCFSPPAARQYPF